MSNTILWETGETIEETKFNDKSVSVLPLKEGTGSVKWYVDLSADVVLDAIKNSACAVLKLDSFVPSGGQTIKDFIMIVVGYVEGENLTAFYVIYYDFATHEFDEEQFTKDGDTFKVEVIG